MSLLSVALLLLTTSLHTTVGDIICLPGKSQGAQVVHIGSNHSVGYKTQHGETYRRNTMCEVHFKKSSSCPSLEVSCPKFDIAHPKANCKGKGGDFLAIGKKRFCQNKGPTNFTSTTDKLTVSFNANKKLEGEGAECTIACSDLEPTSSGCIKEGSINYDGHDIYVKTDLGGEQDCADYCASTVDGQFWTFDRTNDHCYVKSSSAGRTSDDHMASGNRACGTSDCAVEGSTDYRGHDIDIKLNVETAQACADFCASIPGGLFWTYFKSKTCNVKSSSTGRRSLPNHLSGNRACGMSQTSPGTEPGAQLAFNETLGGTDVTAVFEVRNGLSGGVLVGAFIQFDFDSQYSGTTDSNGLLNFTLSPNGPFNKPTNVSTTLHSFVPNTMTMTFKASPSVQYFSVNLVPE